MPFISIQIFAWILLFGVLGCGAEVDKPRENNGDTSTDVDADGHESNRDCNDNDATVHPGADERCDGIDNDCDGVVDELPIDGIQQWEDSDGDGFGNPTRSTTDCNLLNGYVQIDGDCNDDDDEVRPGTMERCDGIDNDCDGATDDYASIDAQNWFFDGDGDGFGSGPPTRRGCTAEAFEVDNDADCNDEDELAYPDAEESCDSIDNDCDGVVDEMGAIDATIHYRDADLDGFGNSLDTVLICTENDEYIAMDGDCDDGDDSAYPGAIETCDSVDNSCTGFIDEGCVTTQGIDTAIWTLPTAPTDFSAGDLSGDAELDIIVADAMSGSFSLYPGPLDATDVEPTWTGAVEPSTGAGMMVRADHDFNGDGQADLLTAFPFLSGPGPNSEIRIFLGPIETSPNFDSPEIRLSSDSSAAPNLSPRSTWFNDFTGDGRDDLLMYTSTDRALFLWPNPSGEGYADEELIELASLEVDPTLSLSTADYNGDGIADLIIGTADIGTVAFHQGPIVDATSLDVPDSLIERDDTRFGTSLCTGNLVDDGYTSLAIATHNGSESDSKIEVFSAEDSFASVHLQFVGGGMHQMGTNTRCDDADGDGHPDLLTAHKSVLVEDGGMAGTITMFHGPFSDRMGSTIEASEEADRVWTGPADGSITWLGNRLLTGDLNHDGKGDILAGSKDALYLFDGSAWTSPHWVSAD